MADTNGKPTLYALLVGINKYEHTRNLKGVNDAKAWKSYLESPIAQAPFADVKIKMLVDLKPGEEDTGQAPSKVNIVREFQEHLGQAKAGDTALFFFAGHGVREETDIIAFEQSESDGKIAGIVCPESNLRKQDNPATNTLSDKELRYLIRKISTDKDGNATAHVVTIFDCCHSGGNTRAVFEDEEMPAASRQVMKRAAKSRTWEGFIFHNDLNDKVFKDGQQIEDVEVGDLLPHGPHIMLAACREVELAWEVGGNGNFTRAMIEVLKLNNGHISYQELHSRCVNRMRFQYLRNKDGQNDQRQTPQFYINSPSKSDQYNIFLSNQPNEAPSYGVVEYAGSAENEWRLSIGALHGIDPDKKDTKVDLYAGTDPNPLGTAVVDAVYPSHSTIKMPPQLARNQKVSYRGKIKGLGFPALKIHLAGDEEGVDMAKEFYTELMGKAESKTKKAPFEWVDSEEAADYTVLADDGKYRIVYPGDHSRHRVDSIEYSDGMFPVDEAPEELYNYLSQITKWTFLKNFNRTNVFRPGNSARSDYPIEVKMYQLDAATNTSRPLLPKGNVYTIDVPEADPFLPIRLEIINRHNKPLYVGLVVMNHLFGIQSESADGQIDLFKNLSKNPALLNPFNHKHGGFSLISTGAKQDADGNKYTEMGIGGYAFTYNWSGYTDYMKLVVSEQDFDLSSLDMSPLPGPDQGSSGTRMYRDVVEKKPPQWEIQTLELFVPNPQYQPEVQAV